MPIFALLAACAPDFAERRAAWEADMAPVVAEAQALDPAALPEADLSTARGRKVLVVEDGAPRNPLTRKDGRDHVPPSFAAKAEEVGIVVRSHVTREAQPSWSYPDGTKGWTQHYEFVAITRPEHAVVARWKGLGVLGSAKLIPSDTDEVGHYLDYEIDAEALSEGKAPGETMILLVSREAEAAVGRVIQAVRLRRFVGPDIPLAVAPGKKVVLMENGNYHDVSVDWPVWAARTTEETGLVGVVERRSVGAAGATFTVNVVTWPEMTEVGRWTETVAAIPGQDPYAVRYPFPWLGATLYAGTTP